MLCDLGYYHINISYCKIYGFPLKIFAVLHICHDYQRHCYQFNLKYLLARPSLSLSNDSNGQANICWYIDQEFNDTIKPKLMSTSISFGNAMLCILCCFLLLFFL